MPTCDTKYAQLPCHQTGVAYTHSKTNVGDTVLRLQQKHSAQLPILGAGQFFYATLTDACNKRCQQVKVVAVDMVNDTVTLDTPLADCMSSNARLRYDICDVNAILAIAESVGLNVTPPLQYDCNTRTLSINCVQLREMLEECQTNA